MRPILSLPGLAVAAWASCLGLLGLLAGMVLGRAWHPHFLPATTMLLLVVVTGLALVVGASWGSDSNGEKNNDLHRDWCSVSWRSGRRRERLNPSSTSKRYLPYGLMCS
jgi:hypothetical protein